MTDTRPFRYLCPEADLRDSLNDGDFWEYVFHGRLPGDPREEDWDGLGSYDPPDEPDIPTPCEICGSIGACAFDTEGRPMIHAVPVDDDDSDA